MTDPVGGGSATASDRELDRLRRRRAGVLDPTPGPGTGRRGRPHGARERLVALLDPDSFVELDAAAGAGVVVGFGTVDGRDAAVYATETAASGDSGGEVAAAKIVKVQDLALRNRIPIVGIHGSGGARADQGISALAGGTDVLSRGVRSSGVIPQVSVIVEPRGDAGALPSIADAVFVLTGAVSPPGLAHFTAGDEAECWAGVRRLLSHLPASSAERPPARPARDAPDRAEAELQRLACVEHLGPYDVREVAAGLLDGGELVEFQSFLAGNVVIGLGRMGGQVVGLVANQPAVLSGAIDADAAVKAARFVRFCDAFNVPLVTLVDTPGFLPGPSDDGAFLRHGAKLVYAYAEATVPKLTVVIGGDSGDAYRAMSPRQLGADLNLAWPTAQIAAGGPFVAAERGYVDDVIEPRNTRARLIRGLLLCLGKTTDRPARKHGNIPL